MKKTLHGLDRAAPEAEEPGSPRAALPSLSRSAVRLHALALIETMPRPTGGRISRLEAQLLAARAGARIGELLDAGLWIETDRAYVIRAGAFAAWSDRGTG